MTSGPPIPPPQATSALQAWARVTVLLSARRPAAALEAAALAAELMDWTELDYQKFMTPRVYGLEDLPVGWCYFEPSLQRVSLNVEVFDRFSMSWCLFNFAEAISGMRRPAFRSYSVQAWEQLDAMDLAEARRRRALGIDDLDPAQADVETPEV